MCNRFEAPVQTLSSGQLQQAVHLKPAQLADIDRRLPVEETRLVVSGNLQWMRYCEVKLPK